MRHGETGDSLARLERSETPAWRSAFGKAMDTQASRSVVPVGLPVESSNGFEDLFHAVFDCAPSGMSVAGVDGRWLRLNDAYCRMLGYEREDLAGGSVNDVTHPDDLVEDREFIAAAIVGGCESSEREKQYVRKDGSILWVNVRAELIRDESGEPLYFVSHLQDISERRTAQEHSRDSDRMLQSVIDNSPSIISVKGRDSRYQLVNREFEAFFRVSSDRIVGRSDAEILPASEIEAIHAEDRLVLRGQTIQGESTAMADGHERLFLTTRFPLRDDRGKIHALCVVSTDVTEHRLEESAKQERSRCSELIYSALIQGRFVLHAQPIVSLGPERPAQFELLIRMLKVRGGEELVAPGEFLPAAERFDLIGVIDAWVIDRAIELAATGHRVALNVSAKTMSDPSQVDRIERAIIAAAAVPENLVFEVTETAVADNLDAARTFAMRLRMLGCAFALDDFGVGYAAFTYLRQLPVNYLKIDIQFVRNMLSDKENHRIVQAIVGVARELEIETIAEGVEDQATLEELRRIGVDNAQGYWIGRPGPLPQLWGKADNRPADGTGATGPIAPPR
jgi:PAS domain S-box-containing protein